MKTCEIPVDQFARERWDLRIAAGEVSATVGGQNVTHVFRSAISRGSSTWWDIFDCSGGGVRRVLQNVSSYTLITIQFHSGDPLRQECHELLSKVPPEGLQSVRSAILQALSLYGPFYGPKGGEK